MELSYRTKGVSGRQIHVWSLQTKTIDIYNNSVASCSLSSSPLLDFIHEIFIMQALLANIQRPAISLPAPHSTVAKKQKQTL
jgi:hypothetical protein